MDQPELDPMKDIVKTHIKGMPIWEHFDRVRSEILLLQYDADCLCEKLDTALARIDRLPLITNRNTIPYDSSKSEAEVVRVYKRSRGVYVNYESLQKCEEFFRKRFNLGGNNVARKSTATRKKAAPVVEAIFDNEPVEEDRVKLLDWTTDIQNLSKSHKCSVECLDIVGKRTEALVTDVIGEFRNMCDLKVPLMLGWKRDFYKFPSKTGKSKNLIVYEAPCGKLFRYPYDIKRYLVHTESILDIDYFSFDRDLVLNRKFGEFRAFHYVENIAIDRVTKKPLENKIISLMNQYTKERLPDNFVYRNETFPNRQLEAKGFSFNYDFKSGCDCRDDCNSRSTCDCHRLNEEFYGKNAHNRGSVETKCQYSNKRLMYQVGTGIFECNSLCKCSSKCANRVVQNGVRFRLLVLRTLSKGWGVLSLDDIPKGSFICTYEAELLEDADQHGNCDMYYADLDYISANEEQKLAEPFLDTDSKKSDEGVGNLSGDESSLASAPFDKQSTTQEVAASESIASDIDADTEEPDDYLPSNLDRVALRYPKRSTKSDSRPAEPEKLRREQRRRHKQKPRFKKIHDILGCNDYTLDAQQQGNVGRFFNDSCDPNTFVQNVFIETHDLRFPVVAFFAAKHIKALDEITWNYNYKIGAIEGREIICQCEAPNCRGRIL